MYNIPQDRKQNENHAWKEKLISFLTQMLYNYTITVDLEQYAKTQNQLASPVKYYEMKLINS